MCLLGARRVGAPFSLQPCRVSVRHRDHFPRGAGLYHLLPHAQ